MRLRMPHRRHTDQQGDTLVEVLVAMAVLSMIIVGGNILMSYGMKNVLMAVEHTQVRNLIVGQSELLHYLRDNAEQGGNDVVSKAWYQQLLGNNDYVNRQPASNINSCAPGKDAFYVTAGFNGEAALPAIAVNAYEGDADTDGRPYAVPGNGLWIEAVESPSGVEKPYVDFHIRACWEGSGTTIDQRTNTVVRLYTQ